MGSSVRYNRTLEPYLRSRGRENEVINDFCHAPNVTIIETVRSYCRFVYQQGGIPVCPQLYLPQFINFHHSREFQVAASINIVLLTKCAEAWSFGTPTHDTRYFVRLAKRKDKEVRYFNTELEDY